MIRIERTDSSHPDFQHLVAQLDAYLAYLDGDDHAFYAQFNKSSTLKNILVAYSGETAVGIGAIRPYDDTAMEVKRMYVLPEHRGKGIASAILKELENWSTELGYSKCILETTHRQPEAISLYQKSGYQSIPNYGQYENMDDSVCFEKKL